MGIIRCAVLQNAPELKYVLMNTPDSQVVVKRFFEALYYLKQEGLIRGKQTFTNEHGINRWNMNTLEKNLESDIFQVAWLTYLVRDYGISPKWLLTGLGPIITQRVKRD